MKEGQTLVYSTVKNFDRYFNDLDDEPIVENIRIDYHINIEEQIRMLEILSINFIII